MDTLRMGFPTSALTPVEAIVRSFDNSNSLIVNA